MLDEHVVVIREHDVKDKLNEEQNEYLRSNVKRQHFLLQERSEIAGVFIRGVNPIVDLRHHERIVYHKNDKRVAAEDLKEF